MTEPKRVPVTRNGKTYFFEEKDAAVFRYFLYCDGQTYHKYLDCHELWSEEYREGFSGWRAISKKEASGMNLRYCKFCLHRDEDENFHAHYEFLPAESSKERKPVPKWLIIVLIVALALLVFVVVGVHFLPDPADDESTIAATTTTTQADTVFENTESTQLGEFHLYDQARDIPVIDTETSQRKGTYSLIKTDSALITDELLVDWYENHVTQPDRGFSLLVFVDKDEKEGIYAMSGIIAKNVHLKENPDDPYLYETDLTDAEYYSVENGVLIQQPFEITG